MLEDLIGLDKLQSKKPGQFAFGPHGVRQENLLRYYFCRSCRGKVTLQKTHQRHCQFSMQSPQSDSEQGPKFCSACLRAHNIMGASCHMLQGFGDSPRLDNQQASCPKLCLLSCAARSVPGRAIQALWHGVKGSGSWVWLQE